MDLLNYENWAIEFSRNIKSAQLKNPKQAVILFLS